jgi:hypothetical protein
MRAPEKLERMKFMNQNGHSEIPQNDHGPHMEVVTEGNPYTIRRRPERRESENINEKETARGIEPAPGMELAEDDAALDGAGPKRDRKRRYVFAAFLSLVIIGAVTFAYAKLGGATKIDHQVKENRPAGITLQAQHIQGETTDQQTEAAIAQAKEARRSGDGADPVALGDAASRLDSAPGAAIEAPTPALPRISIPSEYIEPPEGIISDGETIVGLARAPQAPRARGFGGAGADQSGEGRARNRTADRPGHGASSVYMSDVEETKTPAANMAEAPARSSPKLSFARKENVIILPAFGAMLPVRTLGAVYTLRNSLARLELTRDIAGEGWTLKKGTVLIAQQQGGAFDRAYVNVTGFIDPSTNRFVKMTGEVLGSDGASGLKGRRRQISGRWSRAFNRILNVAPGIAQAALARNVGTAVIVPAGGATGDLIATGGFNFDRREFVEVEAGSSGYVIVTDLPGASKGVDADPEKYLAGPEQGSLNDEELAKLLSEGAPQQIKAAMPRMSPEMRKVAAMAIGDSER